MGKMSDYSLNANLLEHPGLMSGDIVLIFESEPGWNQSGGPDIFNFSNHNNFGWFTTFSRPEGFFIESNDVNRLEWKQGQVPKAQK